MEAKELAHQLEAEMKAEAKAAEDAARLQALLEQGLPEEDEHAALAALLGALQMLEPGASTLETTQNELAESKRKLAELEREALAADQMEEELKRHEAIVTRRQSEVAVMRADLESRKKQVDDHKSAGLASLTSAMKMEAIGAEEVSL